MILLNKIRKEWKFDICATLFFISNLEYTKYRNYKNDNYKDSFLTFDLLTAVLYWWWTANIQNDQNRLHTRSYFIFKEWEYDRNI